MLEGKRYFRMTCSQTGRAGSLTLGIFTGCPRMLKGSSKSFSSSSFSSSSVPTGASSFFSPSGGGGGGGGGALLDAADVGISNVQKTLLLFSVHSSGIYTLVEDFLLRQLFTLTPYICTEVSVPSTSEIGKTRDLLLCLKYTSSVQKNSLNTIVVVA